MPLRDQEARQAGAVGAGPLDAEGADRAQGPRPGLECPVAPLADRDGRRAETGTERVDRDGGVHVLVGVDADDDVGARGLVHGGGPPSQLRGPGDPAVGQDCDGTIALKLLSGHVPLDRQVPPGGADTSTRWHGASQGKGQAPPGGTDTLTIKVVGRAVELASEIELALPSGYPYQQSLVLLAARAARAS